MTTNMQGQHTPCPGCQGDAEGFAIGSWEHTCREYAFKSHLEFPASVLAHEHAQAMLDDIKNACPYSTTFLFLSEGCTTVGQESPLAHAIEKAMGERFRIWAESWIVPRLNDIVAKGKAEELLLHVAEQSAIRGSLKAIEALRAFGREV